MSSAGHLGEVLRAALRAPHSKLATGGGSAHTAVRSRPTVAEGSTVSRPHTRSCRLSPRHGTSGSSPGPPGRRSGVRRRYPEHHELLPVVTPTGEATRPEALAAPSPPGPWPARVKAASTNLRWAARACGADKNIRATIADCKLIVVRRDITPCSQHMAVAHGARNQYCQHNSNTRACGGRLSTGTCNRSEQRATASISQSCAVPSPQSTSTTNRARPRKKHFCESAPISLLMIPTRHDIPCCQVKKNWKNDSLMMMTSSQL